MKITNVNIVKTNSINRVKGIATITIDDCFVVHNIKIMETEKRLFIAMPSDKTPSGVYKNIAHPINNETREMIQNAILKQYEIEN